MDSQVNIYLSRAQDELDLADIIFKISHDKDTKLYFRLKEERTFFSSVISHAYYSIFYSAKALLLTENIKTESPEVHKKTFEAFKKHFIDNGKLDVELLKIYKEMIIRADELLGIFSYEKWKRGHFTYSTIAQANIAPALDSIANAKKFLTNILQIIKDV